MFSPSLPCTLHCTIMAAGFLWRLGHAILLFLLLVASATGSLGRNKKYHYCSTWRFNVEVSNLRGWKVIPDQCEAFVANYVNNGHYAADCKGTSMAAIDYARNLTLLRDGLDAWVFDVDETTLSNIPYYAQNHFGATPFNSTKFNAWVDSGEALAIDSTLTLYNELLRLGFKIFFLTGRDETYRNITSKNLKKAGYSKWLELILRQDSNQGMSAVAYKSSKRKELENKGYRIVGNVGDQWSDLMGYSMGARFFKLPNPMYYIA